MLRTVVVLGAGPLAAWIADWFQRSQEYRLVCVVPSPDRPGETRKLRDIANRDAIPFVESGSWADIPALEAGSGKLGMVFSVAYGQVLPERFLAACDRPLNLHNSALPQYRGRQPVYRALLNNEKSHGVTIHEMTSDVDCGPIVSQLTYSLYPEFDTPETVAIRALHFGWCLFEHTMPLIDRIVPRPQ